MPHKIGIMYTVQRTLLHHLTFNWRHQRVIVHRYRGGPIRLKKSGVYGIWFVLIKKYFVLSWLNVTWRSATICSRWKNQYY